MLRCCRLQVKESQSELKEKTAALATASNQLKLCKMELEGANAQLQVDTVAVCALKCAFTNVLHISTVWFMCDRNHLPPSASPAAQRRLACAPLPLAWFVSCENSPSV